MGYSVGHWAGDTLVVKAAAYNDRTWLEPVIRTPRTCASPEQFRRRDFRAPGLWT